MQVGTFNINQINKTLKNLNEMTSNASSGAK